MKAATAAPPKASVGGAAPARAYSFKKAEEEEEEEEAEFEDVDVGEEEEESTTPKDPPPPISPVAAPAAPAKAAPAAPAPTAPAAAPAAPAAPAKAAPAAAPAAAEEVASCGVCGKVVGEEDCGECDGSVYGKPCPKTHKHLCGECYVFDTIDKVSRCQDCAFHLCRDCHYSIPHEELQECPNDDTCFYDRKGDFFRCKYCHDKHERFTVLENAFEEFKAAPAAFAAPAAPAAPAAADAPCSAACLSKHGALEEAFKALKEEVAALKARAAAAPPTPAATPSAGGGAAPPPCATLPPPTPYKKPMQGLMPEGLTREQQLNFAADAYPTQKALYQKPMPEDIARASEEARREWILDVAYPHWLQAKEKKNATQRKWAEGRKAKDAMLRELEAPAAGGGGGGGKPPSAPSVPRATPKKVAEKPLDLSLFPWTFKGIEYYTNDRKDVLTKQRDWVGRFNGIAIDKTAPNPPDMADPEMREWGV
jgi:hypothetical protein